MVEGLSADRQKCRHVCQKVRILLLLVQLHFEFRTRGAMAAVSHVFEKGFDDVVMR